jgi:hypothetical protein
LRGKRNFTAEHAETAEGNWSGEKILKKANRGILIFLYVLYPLFGKPFDDVIA